ncbi:phosphotransferase family protein [Salinicoccus roseus]|uniref:phosphotransferase family protein n=1 Tax=Salinicoccus roseus TaxID=45670 RepID=UPI001EF41F4D|nr:phosphotransferase [Salinicoccus roseus]MCG7332466.1 phosphotransferase [Salinicoccus roseus]
MHTIRNSFPYLAIHHIEKLDKGWSDDDKYILHVDDEKYLLRLSNLNQKDFKIREYELIQKCYEAGLPVQKPIEHGEADGYYYLLLQWVEGKEATIRLPELPELEQYRSGVEAGRNLRKLHQLDVQQPEESWESKMNRKIDRKISMYNACDYKFQKGHLFLEYIEAHRHLLQNRRQVLHHGDYHVGNMIIDADYGLHIIDFNRHDVGEPWEEFNRIVWSAQASPAFASGQISGYFSDEVPEAFWRLLLLYISANMLSSLPWGVPFGQTQIEIFMEQADEILDWYDDLRTVIPSWFRSFS